MMHVPGAQITERNLFSFFFRSHEFGGRTMQSGETDGDYEIIGATREGLYTALERDPQADKANEEVDRYQELRM